MARRRGSVHPAAAAPAAAPAAAAALASASAAAAGARSLLPQTLRITPMPSRRARSKK